MAYRTLKVFQSTDLPNNLMERMQEITEYGLANGTYLEWEVGNSKSYYSDEKVSREINEWLLQNGAVDKERVVIHYWW